MSKVIMRLNELSCPSCMAKIEAAMTTTKGVAKQKYFSMHQKLKQNLTKMLSVLMNLSARLRNLDILF